MEKYKKVYFDGVTKQGAYVRDAMVSVPEDSGMIAFTNAVDAAGYKQFKVGRMKKLADTPAYVHAKKKDKK